MRTDWETHLERWTAAGVVDVLTVTRIREWEGQHERSQGLRWPTLIALAFGAVLLGAGILLFVSAHWDELSPAQRMTLVVMMTGVLHLGGAFAAQRFEWLSIALHFVGTLSLGAGIALAGQIFHLSEHWPAAVLLWAIGAAVAWALLRHWPQGALTAILVPYWLAGEWWLWSTESRTHFMFPVSAFVCALSFTYLSARRGSADGPFRKALCWLGAIALLPAAMGIAIESWHQAPDWKPLTFAWCVAVLVPLGAAVALRGIDSVWNLAAICWTGLLVVTRTVGGEHLGTYVWCAAGAVGLVWWGLKESRPERINLGIAGFAITVLTFYFSSIMDKLGRSASLIVLGLLFLGGGWLLERTRRQLISQIRPEAA